MLRYGFLQNLGQESEDGMHLTESNENRGYRGLWAFYHFHPVSRAFNYQAFVPILVSHQNSSGDRIQMIPDDIIHREDGVINSRIEALPSILPSEGSR